MGLSNKVAVQRTTISPIGCYVEGKEFLGAEYGQFLGICLVGLLLGGLVPIVLYGPAFCGMALCFLTRARGMIPIVFAGHFVVYRKIFGVEMIKPVMAEVV